MEHRPKDFMICEFSVFDMVKPGLPFKSSSSHGNELHLTYGATFEQTDGTCLEKRSRSHVGSRVTSSSRLSTSSSVAMVEAAAVACSRRLESGARAKNIASERTGKNVRAPLSERLEQATAAVRQRAKFEKLLAEMERERREMEAEEERKLQSQRTKFECDVAVLTANRGVAIADAKLKATEQAIKEDEMLVTLSGNEPWTPKNKLKPGLMHETRCKNGIAPP